MDIYMYRIYVYHMYVYIYALYLKYVSINIYIYMIIHVCTYMWWLFHLFSILGTVLI